MRDIDSKLESKNDNSENYNEDHFEHTLTTQELEPALHRLQEEAKLDDLESLLFVSPSKNQIEEGDKATLFVDINRTLKINGHSFSNEFQDGSNFLKELHKQLQSHGYKIDIETLENLQSGYSQGPEYLAFRIMQFAQLLKIKYADVTIASNVKNRPRDTNINIDESGKITLTSIGYIGCVDTTTDKVKEFVGPYKLTYTLSSRMVNGELTWGFEFESIKTKSRLASIFFEGRGDEIYDLLVTHKTNPQTLKEFVDSHEDMTISEIDKCIVWNKTLEPNFQLAKDTTGTYKENTAKHKYLKLLTLVLSKLSRPDYLVTKEELFDYWMIELKNDAYSNAKPDQVAPTGGELLLNLVAHRNNLPFHRAIPKSRKLIEEIFGKEFIAEKIKEAMRPAVNDPSFNIEN